MNKQVNKPKKEQRQKETMPPRRQSSIIKKKPDQVRVLVVPAAKEEKGKNVSYCQKIGIIF